MPLATCIHARCKIQKNRPVIIRSSIC